MTLRELAAAITERFRNARLPEAEIEAEVLVRTAAGVDRVRFFAGERADAAVVRQVDQLAARRLAREPLAYVSGTREFYGLEFGVNSAVLVPRPESELLVDCTLKELEKMPGSSVFDIGTGSGCLAIAIAKHRKDDGVTVALDISAPAVAVARANAAHHDASVHFLRGSLASPIGRADIVVANLPYIPSADVDELEPEVRDWEPRIALDGGPLGTSLIEQLIEDCTSRLLPRRILLEVALGQSGAVAAFAGERNWRVTVLRDLAGVERTLSLAK